MAAKYIRRHAEELVRDVSTMFGAVLVSGPRQVGKTTMLKHCLADSIIAAKHDGDSNASTRPKPERSVNYVSLDDLILLQQANDEPKSFINDNPAPLFIDEIQKAPALFPLLKMEIDAKGEKGLYFLSGSQQMQMMKNVSESMSGRVGIINLLGLSLREMAGIEYREPFVPTASYLQARARFGLSVEPEDVWQKIHRGMMPELAVNERMNWQLFYSSYVKTYIERDVRTLTQIGDETRFMRFMAVAAACTGQLLNLSSMARDVGVSQPTVERWLSVLVASHIVYLLQPYSENIVSRATKHPKLYFMDTGLVAYLTKWTTPEVLRNGAMAGAVFETFVVAEIVKSYYNCGEEPPLWLYRDKNSEIDLLIERDGKLHPVEIKKHADPKRQDIAAFKKIDAMPGEKRGEGCLLCTYDRVVSLSGQDRVVPVGLT